MVGNPRYGRFGLVGLTHNVLIDIVAPIAEIAGYILLPLFFLLGAINAAFIFAFVGLFILFGVFYSVTWRSSLRKWSSSAPRTRPTCCASA